MDILDEFSDNSLQTLSKNNFQSPFSRTHKFRNTTKKVRTSAIEIIDNINYQEESSTTSNIDEIKDVSIPKKPKQKNINKRKMELADLSIQRLEKATRNTKVKTRSQVQDEKELNDDITIEEEAAL